MRASVRTLLFVLIVCSCCAAQQSVAPVSDAAAPGTKSSNDVADRRAQSEYLRQAREALAGYLSTLAPDSEEFQTTKTRIAELDAKLQKFATTTESTGSVTASVTQQTRASSPPSAHPEFSLAVPKSGRTNIAPVNTLTWTEDRLHGSFQNPPLYELKSFHVVIARDKGLTDIVDEKRHIPPKTDTSSLTPTGIQSVETSYAIPDGKLESGTQYYWQVFAVYTPHGQPDSVEFEQPSDRGPSFFITTLDPFAPLTKRNFSLQRRVDSKDATEGAQFSFLKTFDKKTVFSTDFAFFWDSPSINFAKQRAYLWSRPAVEGKLTSDDSLAEDAWRFSGSAVIDYNFMSFTGDEHNRFTTDNKDSVPRKFIDTLYFELGANLESDQKFKTKKLASRIYFSPSSRMLAIGTATGDIASPVQFIWRPSVEFNAGHTFEVGDSSEIENTVLRVVPRVRMTLYTRGLSRLLRIANSDFFVDNTFYYLPKERFKTRHNFFTSGFELFVLKNFGFGLTYKNGESAPKFNMVRSFGGTLTVRFGPN